MKTDFESLQLLSRYTIDHLMEKHLIDFPIAEREDLIDALATEYCVSFATDEDIKNQALEEVEEKLGLDNIPGDVRETEMYNHARKEIIKSFQGEVIAGLYMVESLNQVANRIKNFLLNNKLIEDVFATDEELVDFLIHKIRGFSAAYR